MLLQTPVGPLTLAANENGLTAVAWHPPANLGTTTPGHPLLQQAAHQLTEYFNGTRTTFTLPLAPQGTPFQLRVWQALQTIPYGHTTSYAALATQLGDPNATRAVGAANGKNPIAILIPCHRVIGSAGALTGFAGALTGFAGGLAAKRHLLALEAPTPPLFQ